MLPSLAALHQGKQIDRVRRQTMLMLRWSTALGVVSLSLDLAIEASRRFIFGPVVGVIEQQPGLVGDWW